MKLCHVCNTECGDFEELCPLCGADLTDSGEETTDAAEERVISRPVLLATFEDVVSAEIFKDILKDNGIPYSGDVSEGEEAIKVVFGGGFVADDIYVESTDFEAANKLYNEFLESEPELDEDFFIEDDGEEV